MSDEKKNEEVIEETEAAQTEEKAETPKEEKKEKARKVMIVCAPFFPEYRCTSVLTG